MISTPPLGSGLLTLLSDAESECQALHERNVNAEKELQAARDRRDLIRQAVNDLKNVKV